MRSGLRSPCAAPVRLSTSSSIRRCAAKPTISRSKSASELFSSSVRRLIIISSVIVRSSVSVEGLATNPYRRSAMTTAVDKWPAAARLVAVAAAGHLPTAPTPPQGTRPRAAFIRRLSCGAPRCSWQGRDRSPDLLNGLLIALRDPLQSAGGGDGCVHREFLFPPRLRGRRRLRPRPVPAHPDEPLSAAR